MSHPFDNPYAEPEPLSTEGMPTFDQFSVWVTRMGLALAHSPRDMRLIYEDPAFRTSATWGRARREMLRLDV